MTRLNAVLLSVALVLASACATGPSPTAGGKPNYIQLLAAEMLWFHDGMPVDCSWNPTGFESSWLSRPWIGEGSRLQKTLPNIDFALEGISGHLDVTDEDIARARVRIFEVRRFLQLCESKPPVHYVDTMFFFIKARGFGRRVHSVCVARNDTMGMRQELHYSGLFHNLPPFGSAKLD